MKEYFFFLHHSDTTIQNQTATVIPSGRQV